MKIFVFLSLILFSLTCQGEYSLPDNDSPNYNKYFYRCVVNTDETMIKLSDAFFRVDKGVALNAVRKVYAEYGTDYVSLVEDMIDELYSDSEMSEKLDKFFFMCLNVVNSIGIQK